jgi:hypothetical protein
VDGIQAQVFLNFNDGNIDVETLQNTEGQIIYVHNNGVHSRVRFCLAGLGVRKIRITNFPLQFRKEKLGKYVQSVNSTEKGRMVKCVELWSVQWSKNITYKPNFLLLLFLLLLSSRFRHFGLCKLKIDFFLNFESYTQLDSLDGGSAHRKAATYTRQQKHRMKLIQISMSRVGFEPTIAVFEQLKKFRASDCPAA